MTQTNTPEYRAAVLRFADAFTAATSERERDDALSDFRAALLLLSVYGPQDGAAAADDPAVARVLRNHFGDAVH